MDRIHTRKMGVFKQMRVLTEEALLYRLNRAKDPAMIGFIAALIHECQEIDTLTVSKLRPMCNVPKDGQWFLGYYKGIYCEYFERLKYSAIGELRSSDDEFEEEDILGWIPMPIYWPNEG